MGKNQKIIMISQEDKAADRELEEIGNIDWLIEISVLQWMEKNTKRY